jgi:hypothetical protein
VNVPAPVNAPEIGECIYCGERNGPLTTEHAVPYGLNGSWTLLEASCDTCAKITHRFERDTMRCLWPEIRIALAMQSRRRSKRPDTLPLVVQRNGISETIRVPTAEYPAYLHTPLFPPPAVFWIRKPVRGVFANLDMIHIAGPTFKEASARYPDAQFVGVRSNFSPDDFARTLAKIGFCAAVACVGLGAFTKTPIRKVILGSDEGIGHWVGCWQGEPFNPESGLHAIKVMYEPPTSMIHAFVRLFGQFGAPEYHIVLGQADPAYVASDRWPRMWA